MNWYIAYFNGKRVEVEAETQWEAKKKVYKALKVPKSAQGYVAVMLAEKNGETVTHIAVD